MRSIAPLDPATYRPHRIHGEGRAWAQTNCYTDVIIEMLHGLGYEPVAALPFTLTIDFEGDQWTFFKFPDADLWELYGLDIQELAVWRPLVDHITEQLNAGRPVLVELDSHFLPDTAGTAYRIAHVKSTVCVNEIDVQRQHLGYFHNQSYFNLQGEDFRDLFQLDGPVHERMLPPYIEYVKLPPAGPVARPDLVEASLAVLGKHLRRIPAENPFPRFRARFAADLEWLMGADMETFHAYSFATLRQYGACYELTDTYLRWLEERGHAGLAACAQPFRQITETAKVFQFQLARAMARRKPLDLSPLEVMAVCWEDGMEQLQKRFG